MNYESKYLKYKTKYLQLKSQLYGGGDKFLEAVKSGDLKLVRQKLTEKHGLINAHFADCNQVECKTGYTPFMIAFGKMDINMMKLLIEFQADVNAVDIHTKKNPIEHLITMIEAQYERVANRIISENRDQELGSVKIGGAGPEQFKNTVLINSLSDGTILKYLEILQILIDAGAELKLIFLENDTDKSKTGKFRESILTVRDYVKTIVDSNRVPYITKRYYDKIESYLMKVTKA